MNKSSDQLEKNPYLPFDIFDAAAHTLAKTTKNRKQKQKKSYEDYERARGAKKLLLSIIRIG